MAYLGALLSFSYAFLIFALTSEAQSEWLRVLGFTGAFWMAVAGALQGWMAARRYE